MCVCVYVCLSNTKDVENVYFLLQVRNEVRRDEKNVGTYGRKRVDQRGGGRLSPEHSFKDTAHDSDLINKPDFSVRRLLTGFV